MSKKTKGNAPEAGSDKMYQAARIGNREEGTGNRE
jgi:hypothetical protein